MSNYGKFISGRQLDLQVGVSSYSENKTTLEVIGKSTFGGQISIASSVGIGTTTFAPNSTLDVNGGVTIRAALYDKNVSAGGTNFVLISTGDNSVQWSPLEDISSFSGITIQDEGTIVGTAGSVTILNFVGDGITATSAGNISTISVFDTNPGGFDGQIQYNNNGDFGGAQNFYYNDSTLRVGIGTSSMNRTLDIGGDVGVSSNIYGNRLYASLDNIVPIAPEELATKSYVDNFTTAGLTVQKAVSAASTVGLVAIYSNGASGVGAKLFGVGIGSTLVLDNYTPLLDERVLIKNQGDAGIGQTFQNGYYVVTRVATGSTTFELVRAADFDESDEIVAGAFSFVLEGSVNAGGGFVLITKGPVAIGTSAIEFTQFSSPGEIIAGDGLVKTGNVIDVVTAGASRIVVNADSIDLATVATSRSNLTTGIVSFISGIGVDGYGRVTGVITSNTVRTATYTDIGLASFASTQFSVSSGAVNLANATTGAVLAVNGTYEQITATRNDGTVTLSLPSNLKIAGIMTANKFSGDGSGLTNLITGIGIQTAGGYVGSGATILDFRGVGISTVTVVGTTATITITGGRDIDTIGAANQVLYKNSSNLAAGSANLTFNGTNLTCGGTVTANSDKKIKKNIATIENALDKVKALRGVEFDYNDRDEHSIGFIAQEVEEVVPDLVFGGDNELKSVAYQNFVAILVEAIKEQQSQIESLKNEIESLRK